MTIRLGLNIANFSYGTTTSRLFPSVVAQAQEAEAAGFDTVLLMDHFYQLPALGTFDQPMLEAYTALGGLATATERVQLGTLVTGNTYRNPALLAKIVSTLDVVSGGRAVLGIGAGWFELEHEHYGFEFGSFTDRFSRLEEAMQIIGPMLKGDDSSFQGRWYRTKSAVNNPRIRDDLPVVMGGSGEKKTFSLAARYADHLNILASFDELPAKLEALARRCEEHDRDPATLETSTIVLAVVDDKFSAGDIKAEAPNVVGGNPQRIAEQIKRNVIDVGVNGVIVNLAMHGYTDGLITKVGEALRSVVNL